MKYNKHHKGGNDMNGREIIKAIMELKNINNATLASDLGITQAALWDRLDTQPRKNKPRKDIPVSLLSEMVRTMDYKVIVVPKNTTVSDDSFVIDENTEELSQADKKPKSNRIKLTNVNEKQSKTLDDLLNT